MRQRVLGGRGYRMPALQQVLVSLASATEVNIPAAQYREGFQPQTGKYTWDGLVSCATNVFPASERKGCPPLSQEGILCFKVLTSDYVCNS